MKILPILLTSFTLFASSTVIAGHNFSAENNLDLINLKLAEHQPLLESSCQHPLSQSITIKQTTALNTSKIYRTKRILHADTDSQSIKSKELNRLNSNNNTPGIELFNLRVSQVKSPISTKYYKNTNRYVSRIELPSRMNLQLDSQLDPVFSSLMFTRSGQSISFKNSIKQESTLDSELSTTNLSNTQLDGLVDSISKLHALKTKSKVLHAVNNQDNLCMLSASII